MRYTPTFLLTLCRLLESESGVHFIVNEENGHTQILTWGMDRSRLFFELTSALVNANTIVLVAHAYGLRDGRVLDEFQITDVKGASIAEKEQLGRIKKHLMDVHLGKTYRPSKLEVKIDALMESVPVSVRHHQTAALSLTAVEVVAADRKGLLSRLAEAISDAGVDIRGANISTFGAQAVDVFFLSNHRGEKLDASSLSKVIAGLEAAAQLKEPLQK